MKTNLQTKLNEEMEYLKSLIIMYQSNLNGTEFIDALINQIELASKTIQKLYNEIKEVK